MAITHSTYQPQLTDAGLEATAAVTAIDESGQARKGYIAAERALTIYLNKREIVTLMTLGTNPELLVLGWLKNQRLVHDINDVQSLQVDWETDSVFNQVADLDKKLGRKTVTTGCGQGTVFGGLMVDLDKINLPRVQIRQSRIYDLLSVLNHHNDVYKRAGAVHGCALCENTQMGLFVEDVGRHNAVDAIAGHMWLHNISGHNKFFYTTGRLTSEMVIKGVQMGIPVLLSRSGVTHMGLEVAQKVGVTLIARAKGRHFLVYNGAENIEFDAIPEPLQAKPLQTESLQKNQQAAQSI
ncbi:MAG: formate dehydrogenase accessory sulfurtransferase FdhD [gamma proteobacterium symbiont of Lucinoma myriamae]|nr:formate dehydrogenase accessory sulfurtransferase FdhD [gamma proteobacterium symbiont of Lucinoma myriamae]MCU7818361.1 formate dehydrogenase accessory sulfurtransferase FdhD [gamma proteobacterium symbiont of Lucinoma myriamae]MCU7832468.1 formate dehydrogenase accessory sulfurtransferase FdhD [gamma proteobacterium symbiont of Lucinoma myriamae]